MRPGFSLFAVTPTGLQDIWVEFVVDSSGKVINMVSIQGGSKVEAKKIIELKKPHYLRVCGTEILLNDLFFIGS